MTELFDYKPENNYKQKEICRKKNYVLYRIEFPSPLQTPFPENRTVYARYYKPFRTNKAIVVLHGLEDEISARYFSNYLAKKGFACLQLAAPYSRSRIPRQKRIYSENQKIDFPEIFKIGFTQTVLDTRKAADFLWGKYNKIGIFGISLGAIAGSVAAGVDTRFGSAVYLLGGGDPAGILWHSRDPLVRYYREVIQRSVTFENLIKRWEAIDPLRYAKPGRNILMINAKYDTAVLPEYTEKLWLALGKPPIKWLKATHATTAFYSFYIQREVAGHFQKTLA